MMAPSVKQLARKNRGGGTNALLASPPLVEKERLTAEELRLADRRAICTLDPISALVLALEAVDPFSSPLRPQGRSCRERPAVDWQANIPHPYPVFIAILIVSARRLPGSPTVMQQGRW